MAGQTTRDRMDGETHRLAVGTQLARQLGNRLLSLRHRHAVTRNDDDAVGIVQRRGNTFGVDCDLLALDFHCRTRRAAEAAEDDRHKGAIHGLAHDVGQDRTRGADQSARDDQEIVAEGEADGRCRPAGIAVQHRNHDRHIGAADTHDQVVADEEGKKRHQDQCPDAGAIAVHDQQQQRSNGRTGIEEVAAWQLLRLAVDLAGQLAESNNGAGERYGTNEDTKENLDLHDGQFNGGLVRQDGGEAGERCARSLIEASDMGFLDMGVETDKDGSKTDKGVQCRYELRHFGHLHAACDKVAEHRTACQHQKHDEPVSDAGSENRGDDGKPHADDAVPDGPLCAFLTGKTAKGEDEQNGCGNIGRGNNTNGHL